MRINAVERMLSLVLIAERAEGLGLSTRPRCTSGGATTRPRLRCAAGGSGARASPPKLRDLVLGADPRQLRLTFALWTREMVERELEVVMSG